MGTKVTLTLLDEGRSPFIVEFENLVRYQLHDGGSVVTCMTADGLVTLVVRETPEAIDQLFRLAQRQEQGPG
jgi:hypothetical protein